MNNNRFSVDNLFIETTRKCNMECSHCLRGDAQNKSISPNYIDVLFEKLLSIDILTITGGEPSLEPTIINQIIHHAKKYEIIIYNFYIATNAKKITDEFLEGIKRLFLYCKDNTISNLKWSNSPWHEVINRENIEKLKIFPFFSQKYSTMFQKTNKSLQAQGRATKIGGRNSICETFKIHNNKIYNCELYLNCFGNMIDGCNWSYSSQNKRENIICSIYDFSLKNMKEFIDRNKT